MNTKQQWTQEEVGKAIAKALENEPEGANKEYWTTDCTVNDIKTKFGLRKFKPSPLNIVLVRPCCGEEYVHVLANKRGLKGISDWRCHDPECRLKVVTLPFGKFAGLTVALVYEQQPSYLAWFCETVEGCEEVKETIRALDGIEAHLTAFRERQHPSPQKRLSATQQEVEWLMGKFSSSTIDKVCEDLFGGEGGIED